MTKSKIIDYLRRLYQQKRELMILEFSYALFALVTFLVSAVIALLNQPLGISLLIVPLTSLLALVVNFIIWASVRVLIEEATRSQTASETKKLGRKPKNLNMK